MRPDLERKLPSALEDRQLLVSSDQRVRTAGGHKVIDRRTGQIRSDLYQGRGIGQRISGKRAEVIASRGY